MWVNVKGLHISPVLLAGIAVGVGAALIILTLLCICLCCFCRGKKGQKQVQIEDPPAPGQYGGPAQKWQQQQLQNNPSRLAEHHVVPMANPPLSAAASSLRQASSRSPTHLPTQSSMCSASSNAPPPQSSRHSALPYQSQNNGFGSSNHSRHGSSIPPPSPALSFGSSQTSFAYDELVMATNGFSEANILGQGGFGLVHKGVLPNGKEIAVKSLKANSGQGIREFQAEVDIISRVHHRHLVSLVGYCINGTDRLLVYEYVPNKTLEFHLHGMGQTTMDWPSRLKVAIGAAKGLAYLHEDCRPRIIHRDIKAANILLDNNFQAKVADFGLAKFAAEEDTHVSTRIMGTLGYLAPEYASTGKLTEESDVYSFGVMLLELITGRRPVDKKQRDYNLVEWARPLLLQAMEDENFNCLVDQRLQYCYKHSEMARMVSCAATCVRKSAKRRPLMSQVVRALEGNMTLTDLNEGIAAGGSLVDRYDSKWEHNGSRSRGNSRGFTGNTSEYSGSQYLSSELDGTTSEYGMNASSSSDGQTTRELDTQEVQRENRRFKRIF